MQIFLCHHVFVLFREGDPEEALPLVREGIDFLKAPGNNILEKGDALIALDFFASNVHPNAAPLLGQAAEVWCMWDSQEYTWTMVPDRFEQMKIYLSTHSLQQWTCVRRSKGKN